MSRECLDWSSISHFYLLPVTRVPPPAGILLAYIGKESTVGNPSDHAGWMSSLLFFEWEIPGISKDEKLQSEKGHSQKLCAF